MNLLDQLKEKARLHSARIVYPEGDDERIAEAACRVKEEKIAEPVLIGNPLRVKESMQERGVDTRSLEIIDPGESELLEEFIGQYSRARNVKQNIARRIVARPLFFGGMMVRNGHAGGMIAGADHATGSVIQAASLTIELKQGFSSPSSYFVMVVPEFQEKKDTIFIFADAAVNVYPDPQMLASSAVSVARDAGDLLGIEPRVAFLSCSTKGSARHPEIDRVTKAVDIAQRMDSGFDIDGELQADAAIVPRVAEKKAKDSSVAGRANVLIFPDLDAGNIAYKLVQYTANAFALGPVMVGFSRPVNDLSRGAVVDDIIGMSAVTAIQVHAEEQGILESGD